MPVEGALENPPTSYVGVNTETFVPSAFEVLQTVKQDDTPGSLPGSGTNN